MKIRLQGIAYGLWLNDYEALEVNCGEGLRATATLFDADEEELDHDDWQFCHAVLISDVDLPEEFTRGFEDLSSGKLPKGWAKPDSWEVYERTDDPEVWREFHETRPVAAGTKGSTPSYQVFPTGIRDFLRKIEREARTQLVDVINLLKWRTGTRGPHNPLHVSLVCWSLDGQTWIPMPRDHNWRLRFERDLSLNMSVIQDVSALAARDDREPLSHQLLREAWQQRTSSPRSSVLLAIAAAEVGVKHCISTLVPDAGFLVENLSSPPIVDLIKNYLPTLPVKHTINGKALAPPKEVRKAIDDGVQTRNKIAHRSLAGRELHEELSESTLSTLLDAVGDLLWMMDYYCGFEWALGYVRKQTRASLGIVT